MFRRVLGSIKIFSGRSKLALQNPILFVAFWYPKSNRSNTLVGKHHQNGSFLAIFQLKNDNFEGFGALKYFQGGSGVHKNIFREI